MADNDNHPRPRRTRQDSAKHYDATRKDLQLSEVLDVLQCYVDFGGGINCCVCGKLYKSRVCFIKHLWEHTVYWDLFAGDKNHMRVLSIQAALILYGTCQQPLRQVPVDSLLVTSPHTTEHADTITLVTPKKPAPSATALPTTPVKQSQFSTMPATPVKVGVLPPTPETPPSRRSSFALKRKALPKLDFSNSLKRKLAKLEFGGRTEHAVPDSGDDASDPSQDQSMYSSSEDSPQDAQLPGPLSGSIDESGYRTPENQGIPFVIPKAPKKKIRRSLFGDRDSHVWDCEKRQRVNRCLVLTPDSTPKSDSTCWKGSDTCKRKRAE